ncbi:hypothetical protein ACFLYU_05015 [Candidatus Dependentiae bacterium]
MKTNKSVKKGVLFGFFFLLNVMCVKTFAVKVSEHDDYKLAHDCTNAKLFKNFIVYSHGSKVIIFNCSNKGKKFKVFDFEAYVSSYSFSKDMKLLEVSLSTDNFTDNFYDFYDYDKKNCIESQIVNLETGQKVYDTIFLQDQNFTGCSINFRLNKNKKIKAGVAWGNSIIAVQNEMGLVDTVRFTKFIFNFEYTGQSSIKVYFMDGTCLDITLRFDTKKNYNSGLRISKKEIESKIKSVYKNSRFYYQISPCGKYVAIFLKNKNKKLNRLLVVDKNNIEKNKVLDEININTNGFDFYKSWCCMGKFYNCCSK